MSKNSLTKNTPKFTAYIIDKVGVCRYVDMPRVTGISPHRLTKIQSDPTQARFDEAKKLAAFLGVSLLNLIAEKKLGINQITLAQADLIATEA